jgi:uncharacterized protein (TIGR03067 family)
MCWRPMLLLGVLVCAGGSDDAKKELTKFQGTWKITRMEVNGVTIPATSFEKVRVVITGDKLSFQDQGKAYEEIECVLDPSKKPPEIDLNYITGLKKGVTEKGIYALEGDTLKICQSLTRKKRPTELGSPKDGAQQLMVLKRVN